ncbi:BatA domain-containing protein [Luteolibacter pohnpeiensis]|uniref:BatA domain-containing protein n=1 Tax=Luteolibacter pohnpeiensis TaxID=454153 RepID=A0A934SA62_9BACT|nr:BatA domain-containing protein [Luteolibacter pohnpeiensis]MBK1881613.1 BatA domain-containing protein [Luteolibacter pohnpeiensis]
MNFIHAAFLASGLAIAIPWLLHLTKKRKYLRVRLGSLQFLQPLVRDRHRMSRVEQWPLLMARCLAILLLALIFSRPFFHQTEPSSPLQGEVLILLDASGSITPQQADELRAQAAKTISSLPPAAKPVIAEVADRVTILPSLDAYHPIPGAAGSPSTAVDWVVDRAAANPDVTGAVHWFTDLQKSQLPQSPGRLWPSGLPVEIHTAAAPGDRNASISQIDLLTPFGGDSWEVEARVQVSGMPGDQPISLTLTTTDGKSVQSSTPAAGGTAVFKWKGEASKGLLSGDVAITGSSDPWPADDHRPFAFKTTQPIKVLLVDGDPTESRFTSETYFLQKALHASSAGKALSPFRAEVSASLPAPGQAVDVIAVCNPPGLSSSNCRLLSGYLEQGTGLIICLGNRAKATGWTSSDAEAVFPPGIQIATTPALDTLRHLDLSHPALAGMTMDTFSSLRMLPLQRRFSWPESSDWKNVMEFSDGSPLLSISANRRVAIFTHQVNREGADLPLDPAFVPLMQNVFSYLAGADHHKSQTAVLETRTPTLEETRPPGFYPGEAASVLISADNEESDISTVTDANFRKALGLPAIDAPAPEAMEINTLKDSPHERAGEFWPWLVAILFLLLAVESALAARRNPNPVSSPAHAN